MNEQSKKSLRRWGRFLLGVPSPNDYIYLTRKTEACRWKPLRLLLNYKRMRIARVFNLEISSTANIGENLHLAHGSGITINKAAVIGKNCIIFKNATIGSVRSGKRAGVPVIGDNCVICIGAFVGGGVHIGNNVMICANAFVNFDVPDDSLVIGNPGVIHRKKGATVDYMRIEGRN